MSLIDDIIDFVDDIGDNLRNIRNTIYGEDEGYENYFEHPQFDPKEEENDEEDNND